jgi:hypothetical protein
MQFYSWVYMGSLQCPWLFLGIRILGHMAKLNSQISSSLWGLSDSKIQLYIYVAVISDDYHPS